MPVSFYGLIRLLTRFITIRLLIRFIAFRLLIFICIAILTVIPKAEALQESLATHFSGDKQIWNRKNNYVELFGHAMVRQAGETLMGDYIRLDLKSRALFAQGNCVYISESQVLWGDEMRFDLKTGKGGVVNGRLSNDRFTLRAKEIHKVGPGLFEVYDGEYTTCFDCAPSWSFLAKKVDMEVGEYAKLSNITVKIKDTPAAWIPYMVLPIKKNRQTGLLFPRFTFGGYNGAQFTLPFFWAINRSSDMTFGVAEYTQRGHRVEWQGRYALSPFSIGELDAFYTKDSTGAVYNTNRWALIGGQALELPFGFIEKLRVNEVSDNLVPFQFFNDFGATRGEAFLPTTLSFSRTSSDVSTYISLNRYRNLLNSTSNNPQVQEDSFDPRTVQVLPSITVTTNDKPLGDTGWFGKVSGGLTRFARPAGPFDYDKSQVPFGTLPPSPAPAFLPGVDPLREATRFEVTPSIYKPFQLWDVLSVVPSVQYRGYLYDFNGFVPSLYRQYFLFQTDLSTQLEKIYNFKDEDFPRAKHLIRPLLTYSYIPFVNNSNANHPFIQQMNYAAANSISGYNFDSLDIIPINSTPNQANYFSPLGNSLTYGLTSLWIRRSGALHVANPSYQNLVEFTANQSLNFIEVFHPVNPAQPIPFSRLTSNLNLNFANFVSQTTYYYYADDRVSPSRNVIATSATAILERATHQKVLIYDRSLSLGYTFSRIVGLTQTSNVSATLNFSVNDFILPSASVTYDLLHNELLSASLKVVLQSLSRCWKATTMVTYNTGYGLQWTGNEILLNLTGSGFGTVTDIANEIQSN